MSETGRPDLMAAAHRTREVVRGVDGARLDMRTPCPDYRVGDLLDHLMGLALAFRHAAEKTAARPGGDGAPGPGGSAERLDPRWREELPVRLEALAMAWRDPAAWSGEARAGGVTLPAAVMGAVALAELVLHGWDLARATGQPFDCDPVTAEVLHAHLRRSAEETGGRGVEGLFGPVVAVPADAPLLDRALGLAGRDPAWTPAG